MVDFAGDNVAFSTFSFLFISYLGKDTFERNLMYSSSPSYLIFPDNERHEAFYQYLPWTPDAKATQNLEAGGIKVSKTKPPLLNEKPVYKKEASG